MRKQHHHHKQRAGYNYHHILARSQNGASTDENLLFIKIPKHQALHRLFGNSRPERVIKTLKHFQEDFELVFGKVSFEEAAKIFERLLRMKGGHYDTC